MRPRSSWPPRAANAPCRLPISSPAQAPPRSTKANCSPTIECDALPAYGGSFEKVGHRRSLVISLVCLAALIKLDRDGSAIEDVRLSIAGIGPRPLRLRQVEDFLKGAALSAARLEQAADMPVSLVASRTRQEYRREVVRGFMARGLINAARRAGAAPDALEPELEAAYA